MAENVFLNEVISTTAVLLQEIEKNQFYKNTISSIKESVELLSISDEKKAEMIISLEMDMAKSTVFKAMDQAAFICERNKKLELENTLLQKQIDNINSEILIKNSQSAKDLLIKDKQAIDISKSTELKTAQINSMVKEDTIKEAQNAKDLLIKDKQAAKLDKDIALLDTQQDEVQETVYDRQQKRPVEVANLTKQGVLIDGQISKLMEDKLYVIAQKTSMIEQVGHNKIIKAMDSMGDMIGTLGTGGLIPSSAMFGVYFRLNKLLTGEDEPNSYTVTKAI